MQGTLDRGGYCGAQWLEGRSTAEETLYWLGLVVDTTAPIVGHVAQRMHQMISADGARNIVDGVRYVTSRIALDEDGRDRVGPVPVADEIAFSSREAAKTDARPGNFVAVGGHGGVVADLGARGPRLTSLPLRRHTWRSELRLSVLPDEVRAVWGTVDGGLATHKVRVRSQDGTLAASGLSRVSVVTYGLPTGRRRHRPAPAARHHGHARSWPCSRRTSVPVMNRGQDNALAVATFAGHGVVHVGRGNTAGMAHDLGPPVSARQPQRHQGPAAPHGVVAQARSVAGGRRSVRADAR